MKKFLVMLSLTLILATQLFAGDPCAYMKRTIESKWGGLEKVQSAIQKYQEHADEEGSVYGKTYFHRVNAYKLRLKVFKALKPFYDNGNKDLCQKALDAHTAIGHYLELAENFHAFLNVAVHKKGEAKKRFDEGIAMYLSILKIHREVVESKVKEFETLAK